jgi:hypothetical protein
VVRTQPLHGVFKQRNHGLIIIIMFDIRANKSGGFSTTILFAPLFVTLVC